MSSDVPSAPQSMDVAEARHRLETFEQGVLTVSEYFQSCYRLVERVHGPITYSNSGLLLQHFMKGLNADIKKILELANVNDAYTARKMAITEEMFSDKEKLVNNGEDSRVQKIEILHYMGWEKMRSYDRKFNEISQEMRELRKENAELKDMLRDLGTKLTPHNESQLNIKKEEMPIDDLQEVKDAVFRLERATKELAENSVTSKALQTVIDRINVNFKPIRDQCTTTEKKVELSYQWVRKIDTDLNMGCERVMEAPRASKRSHHADLMEMDRAVKSSRMSSVESKVLHSLRKVLSKHEMDMLKEDNVTVGVEELYQQYVANIDDISLWMQQNPKPCTKDCSLCGEFHFSYSCDNVRLIKERKKILTEKGGYCHTCWNKHGGKCMKQQECRICTKAEEEGRRVIGGIEHSRMMCPLQEEYWLFKEIADQLFKAKNILEKE